MLIRIPSNYTDKCPALPNENFDLLLIRAFLKAQLVKNPPAMQATPIQFLGQEDPPGEGKGYSLQYSGLESAMDCIVHGVAKSQTRLSDFHFY